MAPESHKPRKKPQLKEATVGQADPIWDFFKRIFSWNDTPPEPSYNWAISPKERARLRAEKEKAIRERNLRRASKRAGEVWNVMQSRREQYQITPDDRKIVDPIKNELKDSEWKIQKKEQVEVFQKVFEMAQVDGQFGYDTYGRYKMNKLDRFLDIREILNYWDTFQKIEGYDLKFVLEKAKNMNEIFSWNDLFQGKSREYFALYFRILKSFSQDQIKFVQSTIPGIATPDGDFGVYTFSKLLEKAKKDGVSLEGLMWYTQDLALPPMPPEKPEVFKEESAALKYFLTFWLDRDLFTAYEKMIPDEFYKKKLADYYKKNLSATKTDFPELLAFVTILKNFPWLDNPGEASGAVMRFLDAPENPVEVIPEEKVLKPVLVEQSEVAAFTWPTKALREKLWITVKDTITFSQESWEYLIKKEDGTIVKIVSEDNRFILIDRIYRIENFTIPKLKDIQLPEEDAKDFQRFLWFKDPDGIIWGTTYGVYTSEKYASIAKIFTPQEIWKLQVAQWWNFSDFLSKMWLSDASWIKIELGDVMLEDPDTWTVTIYNKKDNSVQIYENNWTLEKYLTSLKFFKEFESLWDKNKTIIKNLCKQISPDFDVQKSSQLEIFKILSSDKVWLYPWKLSELSWVEIYMPRNISKSFFDKAKKLWIDSENIQDLKIPDASFVVFTEEKGEPIMKLKGTSKIITQRDVLEIELRRPISELNKQGTPRFVQVVNALEKYGKTKLLTETIKKLVQENSSFAQALFAPKVQDTYVINFHKSAYLSKTLTAYDIFNDKDYISLWKKTYRKSWFEFKETKTISDELGKKTGTSAWVTKVVWVLEKIQDAPSVGEFFSIDWEKLDISDMSKKIELRDTKNEEIEEFRRWVTFSKLFDLYQSIVNSSGRQIWKIGPHLGAFLNFMKTMVSESKIYSEVREKFWITMSWWKYTIKFPNKDFETVFTAYEIFWDLTSLEDDFWNTYFRNDVLGGFYTVQGERLILGTKNGKEVNAVKNSVSISQKPTTWISLYFKDWKIDFQRLSEYLQKLDSLSKTKVIEYLKNTLHTGDFKEIMLKTFTMETPDIGSFAIDFSAFPWFVWILNIFDIFSWSEYLMTKKWNKTIYLWRWNDGFYEIPWQKKFDNAATNGLVFTPMTKDKLPAWVLTPEGYKISEVWFPVKWRKWDAKEWRYITTCWRSAYEFASWENLWAIWIENNYAFWIFKQYSWSSNRRLWNLKWSIQEKSILDHMNGFSSSVGLIFSDASSRNREFGHIATIVYIKDEKWVSRPMVFDNYYGTWTYGKPESLASYISHRGPIRGIIALETE